MQNRRDFIFTTSLGLIGAAFGLSFKRKETPTISVFSDGNIEIPALELKLNDFYVQREIIHSWSEGIYPGMVSSGGSFNAEYVLPSLMNDIIYHFENMKLVGFVFENKGFKIHGSGYIEELSITQSVNTLAGDICGIEGKIRTSGQIKQIKI